MGLVVADKNACQQLLTTNDKRLTTDRHASCFFFRMRFLTIYLVGYFILLLGAGLALWQSGVLRQIPAMWLAIGALIAVGLGIMLAVVSGRPAITTRD